MKPSSNAIGRCQYEVAANGRSKEARPILKKNVVKRIDNLEMVSSDTISIRFSGIRNLTAKKNEMEKFYSPVARIIADAVKKLSKSIMPAHFQERVDSIRVASSDAFLLILVDDQMGDNCVKKEVSLNDETNDVISEENVGVHCVDQNSQDEIGKRERRYKDLVFESRLKNSDRIENTPTTESRSNNRKLERFRFWTTLIILVTLLIIGTIFIVLKR